MNCHICCCKPYAIMYVVNPMLCDDDILYVVNHAMMILYMLQVSMLSCDVTKPWCYYVVVSLCLIKSWCWLYICLGYDDSHDTSHVPMQVYEIWLRSYYVNYEQVDIFRSMTCIILCKLYICKFHPLLGFI